MRLLPYILLFLAADAKSRGSTSRGSSSSRSSSSRSSSSSSNWRSSISSSSRSSSSSGWFSSGRSSSKPSTSSWKPSTGTRSSSGSSGNLFSWFKSSSSRNPRPTASWSVGGSSFSNSRSRGNSAARAAVASLISSGKTGSTLQQKIRRKLSDVGTRSTLSTYAREYRRRPRIYGSGRSGYYYGSYYPYGTYYQHRYYHTSYSRGYGNAQQYLQSAPDNSTDYDLFLENGRNLTMMERNETLDTQRRFTEVDNVPVDAKEIFIPYNDNLLAECPNKVDAFLQLDNISFIFEDHHMFLIEYGALNQTSAISDLFPGVHKVDASVYDDSLDVVLLFQERKVFGFRWNNTVGEFKPLNGFPKNLTESIKFTPSAAFTWADGYPVLVSDKNDFAVYDSYKNDEIKVENQTTRYLENFPGSIRGMSRWGTDSALVFTENKVYQFDLKQNSIIGEPEILDSFLGCFYVEISNGGDVKNTD